MGHYKFALDRLLSQIDSEYFPVNKDDAIESLRHGPLLKARESLVRNLVIVLLKKYLESAGSDWRRIIAALKAIDFMCPATYEEALARKISPLMRSIPDSSLDSALLPLKNIPKAWGLLEIDVSQRITAYVRALPSKHLENIEWLVESEQFSEAARARISSAGRKELKESIFFGLSAPMADRYIQLYLESESFDQANEWAREIIGYIGDFDQGQMRRLVVEGAQNPEVRGSFRFPDVILAIRKSQKIEVEALDSLIAESGINDD
ncbi:hypothetical protein ABXT00_11900 [Stenotrophomonas koreensis]|uniref:hypothetical protein n=1 Tax=Stenotrophomonas koreensis TaxID=266128 RepID=UPI003395CBF0